VSPKRSAPPPSPPPRRSIRSASSPPFPAAAETEPSSAIATRVPVYPFKRTTSCGLMAPPPSFSKVNSSHLSAKALLAVKSPLGSTVMKPLPTAFM